MAKRRTRKKSATPEPAVTVTLDDTDFGTLPDPVGANFFHFTFSGIDAQLLVGYVDLLEALQARGTGKPRRIAPRVTHRFAMSAHGLLLLKRQVDEIVDRLREQGVYAENGKAG